MNRHQVIRSTCSICPVGCGALLHLANGQVTSIEGDPDSPVNKGKLCRRGMASLEYLYHPDRLKHPLRRLGERGGTKWQQITWDEALSTIAEELIRARDNYGPESVAVLQGSAKGLQDSYAARFANVFGTPNVARQGHVCHRPATLGSIITCGFSPSCDYGYPPACIIAWGSDPYKTDPPKYEQIIQAVDSGTKLVVVNPRKIGLAERAELWLQLRPGSDLTLALGMINVIVNEGLYDKAFVDSWTFGFEELKAHVQDYPPEKVEGVTWINAQKIRQAARLYALTKPGCIPWGNALDHNLNSFQTWRAISILRAITGNLGAPGGDISSSSPLPLVWKRPSELELWDKMPMTRYQNRVGADLNLLPIFRDVLPQSVIKAILEEDPYPVRAAYIQGCNPVVVYPNAQETCRALKKLDFLAVVDMFMTPTADLADVVLPAASYLEFDSIIVPADHPIDQIQQKVAQVGECWSDYKILSGLAKKLGLGEYFWDSEEECLDSILKPAGLTFKEFRKIGSISATGQYRGYQSSGFETPSKKVELYSNRLKDWGLDPLPIYRELPETPYSTPELAKQYPLILTSRKSASFRHSGSRQITTLRGCHPEPVVDIHPETAGKLRIKGGDWVYIETKRGRIKQKAVLSTSIDPRVVSVDYGWWFPEEKASELHGWSQSNINILTDSTPPYSREIGSTNLRSMLCKVYKASYD